MASGFHQRWNTSVGRQHPSLWLFLRKLKDQERLVKISVVAARRGLPPPPPRKRKWRELEHRIHRLKEDYNQGILRLNEFWNAMANIVRHF